MRSALPLLVFLLLATAHAHAQDDDAVPEPPPSVELRPSTVRFHANLEGLRVLYLQDPTLDDTDGRLAIRVPAPSRYVELCDVPCDRELPQTHLGLAVARGDHLIRFDTPLGVDGPTDVSLRWHNHEGVRLGGLLLATIGGAAGLGLGAITLAAATDDAALAGGLAAGGALLIGSVIVGILLALMGDRATFEAAPLPADGTGLFSDRWD